MKDEGGRQNERLEDENQGICFASYSALFRLAEKH